MMTRMLPFLMACLLFAAPLYSQDQIIGLWWTPKKDGKIAVYKEQERYFGKIVWGSKPRKDYKNPDPNLRGREVVGLVFLRDFVYDAGERIWNGGKIYDPETGKTYDSKITISKDQQQMHVRGFVGLAVFGRTETFTRVKE